METPRFIAESIVETQNEALETLPVGTVIIHPEAWHLCMPGYRNEAARFKPADEATLAKVTEEMATRQPVLDQTLVFLQKQLNELAASGKFTVDAATGFFKRDAAGTIIGKLTNVQTHVLETAAGYGLKPVAPVVPEVAVAVKTPVSGAA